MKDASFRIQVGIEDGRLHILNDGSINVIELLHLIRENDETWMFRNYTNWVNHNKITDIYGHVYKINLYTNRDQQTCIRMVSAGKNRKDEAGLGDDAVYERVFEKMVMREGRVKRDHKRGQTKTNGSVYNELN
nr:hypothetical protein [uncultured Methanoregula sp.]